MGLISTKHIQKHMYVSLMFERSVFKLNRAVSYLAVKHVVDTRRSFEYSSHSSLLLLKTTLELALVNAQHYKYMTRKYTIIKA